MDAVTSPPARAIRLRRDATIEVGQDGCAAVTVNGSSLRLPSLPAGARAVLESLGHRDVPDADAQQQVLAADGMPGLLRWQAIVLIAVTIVKVFFFDVSELDHGWRVLSFIVLGGLLLAISYAYQRDWLGLQRPRTE